MTGIVNAFASSIIHDNHEYVRANLDSHNPITITEVTRLVSLNQVWRYYLDTMRNSTKILKFTKLSHHADQLRISKSIILEPTIDILDSHSIDTESKRFKELSRIEFANLLGKIHCLCSYPVASQRKLGAIYTPKPVADYIVQRTMKPVLEEIVQKKSNREALDHILRLRILDHACGPGVFLLSSFEILLNYCISLKSDTESINKISRRLRGNLYGVDLDAGALEITNASLSLIENAFHEQGKAFEDSSTLKQGNSLISRQGSQHFTNLASRIPFDWSEEFPEIFSDANPGFDFVIFNPPYDRLKPNLAEYLRRHLMQGDREILLAEYDEYKNQILEDVAYYRKANQYTTGNRYTINAYRLFIERALQLVRENGRIGFIVPSTLLGDLSSAPLRKELLFSNRVNMFDVFPEQARIFEGVTQSVCIATVTKGSTTKNIPVRFNLLSIFDAESKPESNVDVSYIRDIMGPSMQIPRIKQNEWRILKKLHKHPQLRTIDWLLNHRGEFDLTLDKKFVSSDGDLRLVRGSDLGRYRMQTTGTKSEFIDSMKFQRAKATSARVKHIRKQRIACQQVSNQSQRWRLKFAMIEPDNVLANSCNYLLLDSSKPRSLYSYLLGLLNSDLLNWRFAISNTNNHVSNRELGCLPIPEPSQFPELATVISELVQSIQYPSIAFHAEIESKVSQLFGLNQSEVKGILMSKGADTKEVQLVLDYLKP